MHERTFFFKVGWYTKGEIPFSCLISEATRISSFRVTGYISKREQFDLILSFFRAGIQIQVKRILFVVVFVFFFEKRGKCFQKKSIHLQRKFILHSLETGLL